MSASEARVAEAGRLMLDFAERTGLSSGSPPRRYLWTDAFAVCNFLALERSTGDARHRELALRLVDQVHAVLGRHRPDDPRGGWLSGLDEAEGQRHPTRGGLRIGKPLPERREGAPFDERLEWERDGQYFHYLTRWMHALDQVARATGRAEYNVWARELAEVAWRAFTLGSSGRGLRMAWKLSIDLSRPLVPSTGQHDPLDGLVTCAQLEATAVELSEPAGPDLKQAASDFAALVRGRDLATADPLGLGGLLCDAARVAQLLGRGAFVGSGLLHELLAAAQQGLSHWARGDELQRPAELRLAFREIGLAIGLAALPWLERWLSGSGEARALRARLEDLRPYAGLGSAIVSFWCEPAARSARSWTEHLDIDEVMLASALVPDGVLLLAPAGRGAR